GLRIFSPVALAQGDFVCGPDTPKSWLLGYNLRKFPRCVAGVPKMATLADFELRTLPGLWRWYDHSARELAFRAQSPAEAEIWQETLRGILTRLLGGFPTEKCDL